MPALGTALATAFKASTVGGWLIKSGVGKLLASVALSALQVALVGKPAAPGITTEYTQNGGTNPASFVLGRYATAGDMICPPMTHGKVGKTPNAYLTYVIGLGDVVGESLDRLIVDGAYATIGTVSHPDYGLPLLGRHAGYGWVKYYNGTQTVADPMLLAKYGTYPERPWLSDMVGVGICYAILTFRLNRALYPGQPTCRFEMKGIPLYDPRKDSTIGGTGAHRWSNRATWEHTVNPLVISYNIMRGITLPEGSVWGGGIPVDDLPLANWFSAMNQCDVPETLAAGGAEPRYRTGYEVAVSMEPAAVLEEVFRASNTQIAEVGGVFKVRTGGPGLPVYFITDDDIVISKPSEMDPFPGEDQRYNGIAATYPEPEALWEPKDAPTLYNALWEAEDGGKRRVAKLSLNACPFPFQAQRLMDGYAKDERRHRRHSATLPPDAAVLEPLDTLAWTSAQYGYVARPFEVSEIADIIETVQQRVSMREVDPTDFVFPPGSELPVSFASSEPVAVPPQSVAGFDLDADTVTDGTGASRRVRLRLLWDGEEQDGITALEYEIRVAATGLLIKRGTITDVSAGELFVSDGVMASTAYQARMRPVASNPVVWTAWETASTSALLLNTADLQAQAVTRTYIGRKTGSSVTVTATTSAAAQIIIAPFDVDFDSDLAGTNPILFNIFGRGSSITAPSSMQFLIEAYFAGTWQIIDISLPHHCAETNYSTRTHHFSYGFFTDYYDPAMFEQMRVRCWVSTASPYSSHAFMVDYLTMTTQQANR